MALVATVAPELMTFPLAPTSSGQISAANLAPEVMAALMTGKTVMAIGPGLGQSPDTVKFTSGLLSSTKIPAVIDADALNILAAKPVLLAKLAKSRTLVLTPHPGEMARLLDITVAEVQANRLAIASSFAQRIGVTLVLKGARTLVAHPDGSVAVNTSGTAGSISWRGRAGGGSSRLSAWTGRGPGAARGRSAHVAGHGQPGISVPGVSLSSL
jgi:NAD(P)H-hydrate epimerase